jgi:hypothetical protein
MTAYQGILSGKYFDLLEQLRARPDMRAVELQLDRDETIGFMRDYDRMYRVGTWPIILTSKPVFDEFAANLPMLCYKIIKLAFGDDAKSFSRFFNLPSVLYHVLKDREIDFSEILIRYDGAFSGGEFKLMEINSGSAIGGWQLCWIANIFSEILARFPETASLGIRQSPVTAGIFNNVINMIRRRNARGATGSILWYWTDGFVQQAAFEAAFAAHYDRIKPVDFEGTLQFLEDANEIEFTRSGLVVYRGRVIDAVMLPSSFYQYDGDKIKVPDFPKSLVVRLGSSHMAGQVSYPDSPFYTLLGSKRLLALLHSYKEDLRLEPLERQLLGKHVPWCHRMSDTTVDWRRERWRLQDLLRAGKDHFVLKKSASCQGKDVIVGARQTSQAWEQALVELTDPKDWIAQEYCVIDPIDYCPPLGEVMPHDFVWGVFASGNQHIGEFLRAVPTGTGKGVINSAAGALEVPVFSEV